MKSHWIIALVTAVSLATGTTHVAVMAQSAILAGTGKDEAKKPYLDFTILAWDVEKNQMVASTTLDLEGNFTLPNLASANYLVEMLNKDGKIICTEGPFDLTQQPIKNDVIIDCDKIPAAFWLLTGAGAAGITAGVAAADVSPSR